MIFGDLRPSIYIITKCLKEDKTYDTEAELVEETLKILDYIDTHKLDVTKKNITLASRKLEEIKKTEDEYSEICKECFSLNE